MGDFDSDSSDSETSGDVRNVIRQVIRPPGHSGKAKKGQLMFDASFESGNLGRVDYICDYEVDLFIRPDITNPRHRIWFNFTVENTRGDQRVVFTIVNFSKYLPLFHEGLTPVVRSVTRPKWHRLPAEHVYYYRSPNHHGNHVLSFAFAFDKEEDVYQFAFCYPYSYSRLQRYLELEELKQMPFFQREQIGESVQERAVDLVTITNNASKAEKRKYVIVTSRVHPGETPSSFVCQGFMNFLLGDSAIARTLRDYIIFKIVPMLNPDGVFVGNYRTALLGSDLNRCWQSPSPLAHPDIYVVKNLVESLCSSDEGEVDMYLDLHAHTGLLGTFIYGNCYDDVYRQEKHALFPKFLGYFAEDFSLLNTVYNRDPGKSGTSRRFFSGLLNDKINCYTVEVSFYGYPSKSGNQVIPYTEETYLHLGENLAKALLDYYVAVGHIPANLATANRKGGSATRGGASSGSSGLGRGQRSTRGRGTGAKTPGKGTASGRGNKTVKK